MKRQTRIIDEKKVKKYFQILFEETNSYEQKEIFRMLKDKNSMIIKTMINEMMKNNIEKV
jgi:hypothetical protein